MSADTEHAVIASALDATRLAAATILSVDTRGCITDWNRRAEGTFGWSRGEVLGHSLVATIVSPRLRAQNDRELGAFLGSEPGAESRIETVASHRDGREFEARLVLVPVSLGRTPEFTAFLDDVAVRPPTHDGIEHLRRRHSNVLTSIAEALGDEPREQPPGQLAGALVLVEQLSEPGVPEASEPLDIFSPPAEPPELLEAEQVEVEPEGVEVDPEPLHDEPPAPDPAALPPPGISLAPSETALAVQRQERALVAPEPVPALLEGERLVLCAQPVLNLGTNEISQYELQLKVADDEGRLTPPEALVFAAERYGVVGWIDRWLVRRAAALAGEHQRDGVNVRLALALSGQALLDPDLVQSVERELSANGTDAERLVLQISEAAAVANVERAAELVSRLRSIGCGTALADVGSSFTSLRHLKRLPVDQLRLHGGVTESLADSRTDRLVLRALVEVAHGVDALVVADLVSAPGTLEVLRREGVDLAQGVLVGRAATAAETWPGADRA
ncbi:MAG TPA: EAL domain-containing protein [Thermoleophilaceae bacterium]